MSNFKYWDTTNTGNPKRKPLVKADSEVVHTAQQKGIWLSYDGELSPDVGEFCYVTGQTLGMSRVGIVKSFYYIDGMPDYRWTTIMTISGKEEITHAYCVIKISKEAIEEIVDYFRTNKKIISNEFNDICFELKGYRI